MAACKRHENTSFNTLYSLRENSRLKVQPPSVRLPLVSEGLRRAEKRVGEHKIAPCTRVCIHLLVRLLLYPLTSRNGFPISSSVHATVHLLKMFLTILVLSPLDIFCGIVRFPDVGTYPTEMLLPDKD